MCHLQITACISPFGAPEVRNPLVTALNTVEDPLYLTIWNKERFQCVHTSGQILEGTHLLFEPPIAAVGCSFLASFLGSSISNLHVSIKVKCSVSVCVSYKLCVGNCRCLGGGDRLRESGSARLLGGREHPAKWQQQISKHRRVLQSCTAALVDSPLHTLIKT